VRRLLGGFAFFVEEIVFLVSIFEPSVFGTDSEVGEEVIVVVHVLSIFLHKFYLL